MSAQSLSLQDITLSLRTNLKEGKLIWDDVNVFLKKIEQSLHRHIYLSQLISHGFFAQFTDYILDSPVKEEKYCSAIRLFLELTFSFDLLKECFRQVSVDKITLLVSYFTQPTLPVTPAYMNDVYPIQLRLLNQLVRNAIAATDACTSSEEVKNETLLPPLQMLVLMDCISIFTKLYSCFTHISSNRGDIIRIIERITDSFENLFCLLSLPQKDIRDKFLERILEPVNLKIHIGQLNSLFTLFLFQYNTPCTPAQFQMFQQTESVLPPHFSMLKIYSTTLSSYFAPPLPNRQLLDHLLSNVVLHLLRYTDMFFQTLVSLGHKEKKFAQLLASCVHRACLCMLRDSMNNYWASSYMRLGGLKFFCIRICQYAIHKWFPYLKQWKVASNLVQTIEKNVDALYEKSQQEKAQQVTEIAVSPSLTIASIIRTAYKYSLTNECYNKHCTETNKVTYQSASDNTRLNFIQGELDKTALPFEIDNLSFKSCSACHLVR